MCFPVFLRSLHGFRWFLKTRQFAALFTDHWKTQQGRKVATSTLNGKGQAFSSLESGAKTLDILVNPMSRASGQQRLAVIRQLTMNLIYSMDDRQSYVQVMIFSQNGKESLIINLWFIVTNIFGYALQDQQQHIGEENFSWIRI